MLNYFRFINLYQKWGHGGFGVVLTGNIQVDQRHIEFAGNTIVDKALDCDERRNALRRVALSAKLDGALVFAQISHAGRQTPLFINEHPYSASDVQLHFIRSGTGFGKPVPLTVDQIKEVVARFAYAAKYCADAGFDGIELHCAHGYLLSQFLTPTTNKRTDQYGGSLENRTRIVCEIYKEIRNVVPKDFVIGAKVNSVEFQKDGLNTEEATEVCKILENVGFDFIELSGGTYEHLAFQHERESTRKREAFFLEFADRITKQIKKSIIYVTGGFRTAKGMCEAVQSGATQGIGLGRPAAQEPDLPKKILSGNSKGAIKSLLNQDDFFLTLQACNTQMAQAGKKPYTSDAEICGDIMDLSDQAVVDEFLAALKKFLKEAEERTKNGEVVYGVVEFRT
ncbi:unnamed protein product [Gongylonema pulchrum]|uniref:Oxidored_FMN domain-containing protein n=1 Tax=Gongylonema pulchrum TaxID=637853 RepID=A0A183EMY4_9BILA|nr:unnamed protein product [Gongylonema pulchrum]